MAIKWHDWSKSAFELANSRGIPVLLSISASWCHWCHVMDERTFGDPRVASLINSDFVPVRVDTDVRPDVNAVYNMGGWPTVAILNHNAGIIDGATYVPADKMLEWLRSASSTYPSLARAQRAKMPSDTAMRLPATDFTPSIMARQQILSWIDRDYDGTYGGFGTSPKFPMFDCLNLILQEYEATGNERWRNMLEHSMAAMTGGGTFDMVEGGLFRYSTTRDWSLPHFEKMLLDNALMLRLCGKTFASTGEAWLGRIAQRIYDFMTNTLYMDNPGGFGGSQDADESYYSSDSLELRRRSTPPRVDRRIYSDWNSIAAGALISSGRAFKVASWIRLGLDVLRTVHNLCFDPIHGMAHVWDDEVRVWGLAHDHIAHGSACLEAYHLASEPIWLERSMLLASRLMSTHGNDGVVSRLQSPDDPPGFARPVRDFHENAYAAIWLTRLSSEAPNPADAQAMRTSALRCLAVCDEFYGRYGIHAAAYGVALHEYLSLHSVLSVPGVEVTCEGGVCSPVPPGGQIR